MDLRRAGARAEHALPLLVLAALTAVAGSALLRAGWFDSHEGPVPVFRVIAAAHEIRFGDLYPRWLSGTYHGRGSPFFEFYAPGAYLLPAYLYAAGAPLVASMKAVLLAMTFVGAWGAYAWCRRHLGTAGALLAAVLYLFAPYHFVDLYVRGALAEFAALAVVPWLFAGIDAAVERPFAPRALAGVAMAAAGVVLLHNLTVVMIAPFAGAYAIARAAGRERPWRPLASVVAGAALGAAVSAFYSVPMLADLGALHDLRSTVASGDYYYASHFVTPPQLVATRWGFGGSIPGPDDGMSFQLGLPALAALALALVRAAWLQAPARRFVVLSAVLAGAAVWLTLPGAEGLYRLVPALRILQFPWRFLGPATLFLAAAAGAAACEVGPRAPRVARAVLVAGVVAAVWSSAGQREVRARIAIPEDRRANEQRAADGALGTLTAVGEYLPRWADPRSADAPPRPVAASAGASVRTLETAGDRRVLSVQAPPGGAVVTAPCYYFPGWEAFVDGRRRPASPSPEGLTAVTVPEGSHVVDIRFGTTVARVAGWLVAGFAAATLVVLALLRRRDAAAASLRRAPDVRPAA